LVEGEFSTPRKTAAGIPQESVLATVLYSLYTNNAPAEPGTHLALFADDTCIYEPENNKHVLNKLQHDLNAVNLWCECWNIKIIEGKTLVIYFSRNLESLMTYYN
jgi:hypothetical protein